jgi:hypothetical protein
MALARTKQNVADNHSGGDFELIDKMSWQDQMKLYLLLNS